MDNKERIEFILRAISFKAMKLGDAFGKTVEDLQ